MVKFKSIIIAIILLLIFFTSIVYRFRLSTNPEYYDPKDPTAFYWTENALQYHYAELIASGEKIPSFDPKLQAPEGVKIFENLTILMEYPCGWLYRIFRLKERNVLFHTWTIIFIAGCASLGIFAIFFLSRAIGISHFYSILACLLFNFSLVSVGRSTFGFLNEDFALPFIAFGLASYFYAIRSSKNKILFSFLSGICFLISLCSWHFSRFIFLAIVFISVFNLWVFERGSRLKDNALVLFYTLLIPFIGSFFVPVLKSRLYFLSLPFALSFGAILGIFIFKQKAEYTVVSSSRGRLSIIIGLVFLAVSIVITRLLNIEAEYTHVWSLIINKIKFFGIKPADPGLLDYPARSLWIEAFNSPHPVSIFKNLFPLIIPALFSFVYLTRKRFFDSSIRLFIFFSIIFFLGYLTIERMGVVNNYFVSVLAAAIGVVELKKGFKFYNYLPSAVLGIVFLFNFYQGYHLHNPTGYITTLRRIFGNEISQEFYNWRLNNLELVRFIRHETPEDAIFLSSFGVGPLIFTYARRPIVLQPKFEVKNCQKLVKEFFDAIYSSETEFYNYCKSKNVNYFLYDIKILLDDTRDGSRWIAGKKEVHSRSAAFLLHFFPEDLAHFELVYQNNFYRLYRVVKEKRLQLSSAIPYQSIYDLKAFGNQTKNIEFFDDRYTEAIMQRIKNAKFLLQKAHKILTRDPKKACQLMEKSFALYPSLIGSATTLGIAYALTGRLKEGLALCQKEVEINPLYPLAHYNLAYCLYLNNDINRAIKELNETLRLDPNFEPAKEILKQLTEGSL
ncbi:MAG: tetratricopeptide repeat protein [candidate division WOR-3 bacterium]|nr:tetratricopeptide repeat protein [candidate division WOR-3 bacterium]